MKWDLSDIDKVPEEHTPWFNTWVLPVMLSAQEVAEVVQDVAVRVWVNGPDAGGEANIPAERHWIRETKVVKQHAKPRTVKRERLYDDAGWDYVWEEAKRYDGTLVDVADPADSVHEHMLLDAPASQRSFLVAWAIDRLTVEEASRRVGISRATGYRWRDELMYTLQTKWGE